MTPTVTPSVPPPVHAALRSAITQAPIAGGGASDGTAAGSPLGATAGPSSDIAAALGIERARIDALDAEIAALVLRRQEVSRGIQQLRMSVGRPRVEHSREIAILAGYKRALGPLGTRLGMAVLDLCRGQR